MFTNRKVLVLFSSLILVPFSALASSQKNLDFLLSMPSSRLAVAANKSGVLNAILKACPTQAPSENGKAFVGLPVLLYEGEARRLKGDLSKIKKAIRVYEDAYVKTANGLKKSGASASACGQAKAKQPTLFAN